MTQSKAAVVAGDKANIGRLYTLNPPAQAKTPAGDSTDPSEEAAFWAGISAKGLAKFDPKLMEILEPQDGAVLLVLRVEFHEREKSGGGRRGFALSGMGPPGCLGNRSLRQE